MKHEFTDQQIDHAMGVSQEVTGDDYILEVSFEGIRTFLDALPEPQDDWQECSFEDIRNGDRVRMVQAVRTTDFHLPVVETHPTHLVLQDNTQCSNFHKAVYYRIPAPVTHPDPEQHPVIANVAVAKPGTDVTHRYDYATWDAEFRYECWNHDGSYYGSWEPNTITEWEPAKVVPKESERQ